MPTTRRQALGIFGVARGNDVSERDWQNGPDKDLQYIEGVGVHRNPVVAG